MISIVTPSFNQGRYIEEALLSVKEQNYPRVQHIVVDGASTDRTLEILKRYAATPGWEHLCWISEPDRGQSDALNKGFRAATGDLIGWLNSDDRYLPGCFETIAAYARKHAECDIVYGDYRIVDEMGKVLKLRRELGYDLFMLKYVPFLYIPTPSAFIRRLVFEEGNFIDINYHYAMDYEFFLRLALQGYNFGHVRFYLADFRLHSMSKTGAASHKQLQEHRKALLTHDPFLRRIPRSIQTAVRLSLAGIARSKRLGLKALKGCYFEAEK